MGALLVLLGHMSLGSIQYVISGLYGSNLRGVRNQEITGLNMPLLLYNGSIKPWETSSCHEFHIHAALRTPDTTKQCFPRSSSLLQFTRGLCSVWTVSSACQRQPCGPKNRHRSQRRCRRQFLANPVSIYIALASCGVIARTQWHQLRWNLSQSAETLGDGVGYRSAVLVSDHLTNWLYVPGRWQYFW